MIRVLNKHHRWLMIVIGVLALPFIFYFNKTDFSVTGTDNFGQLYGKTVTRIDYQRNARLLRLASDLGMSSFVQDLTTNAQSENELYQQFMVNRLVLRHEAEQLGIRPSTNEITDLVKTFRAFQGEKGGFDINKYSEFTKTELGPSGFSEAQIEELAADQLALTKLKTLLSLGVQIPETESKANYERAYGKIDATVVRLHSADFQSQVNVTDDDVAKYFESHKAQFNSEETRKVKFVTLTLNEEQKKLAGKERIDALQKIADHATDFTQALLEKGADFEQVAAKFQLPVAETADFTAAKPDPQLAKAPQVAQSAFQLTKEEPNSDALQSSDGFFVLHLTDVKPARPLTLDEARPKIVETLKRERVQQLVSTKAVEAANKIREALKSNQPVDAAVQQVGLKADKVPPFALMDPPTPPPKPGEPPNPNPPAPDLPQIKQASAELAAGEVSDFVSTPDGGLVVAVEKREAADESKAKDARASLDARYVRGKREMVFYEWLSERRRAAGVQEKKVEPELPG
jgi:peptidyl-prolyl cis-trans isomerase D